MNKFQVEMHQVKTLGQLIREFRELSNLPQRKIASELDMDVAVLSRIENGGRFPRKRSKRRLEILSEIMDP